MKVNYRLQDVFENKLIRIMQKPVYLGLGPHLNEWISYIIIIYFLCYRSYNNRNAWQNVYICKWEFNENRNTYYNEIHTYIGRTGVYVTRIYIIRMVHKLFTATQKHKMILDFIHTYRKRTNMRKWNVRILNFFRHI